MSKLNLLHGTNNLKVEKQENKKYKMGLLRSIGMSVSIVDLYSA